eukprot:gene23005-29804_t
MSTVIDNTNNELNSNNDLINNINIVKDKINQTAISVGRDPNSIQLVAVSKTKPIENIQTLYDNGQYHFGENYFQELVDKAEKLPRDIKWHFIGHLQSSKASKLIRSVSNLFVIETIDSIKLAKKLQLACETVGRDCLYVYIQVDTSLEDTKSGVLAEEVIPLAQEIVNECPNLKVKGVMTIGAPGDLSCFDKLIQSRNDLANYLSINPSELEVSMGMSGDFEEAIVRGATSVRVGSTIFGARIYPNKT